MIHNMANTSFTVVPDTNIVVASEKSTRSSSPNKEFFERWGHDEFELLYSDDTLLEYIEKLREKGIEEESIKKLIRAILKLGREVLIEAFYSFSVCKPLDFLCELRRELTTLKNDEFQMGI